MFGLCRVPGPYPGQAAALQLNAHRAGLGAGGVLDLVPVLVGHPVLLGRGTAVCAIETAQFGEETGVELGGAIRRAVERADGAGCRAARGIDLSAEDLEPWFGTYTSCCGR